jgi:hypothetical protein
VSCPRCADLIFSVPDERNGSSKSSFGQTMASGDLDPRVAPDLGLALGGDHVNV